VGIQATINLGQPVAEARLLPLFSPIGRRAVIEASRFKDSARRGYRVEEASEWGIGYI
jgi:hypothetical protein